MKIEDGNKADEYRVKIHRYLARLVGNDEAEDLTQEVLLKVSQASFRGESKFSTWIYRVSTNTALDFLRKRNRASQSVVEGEPIDESHQLRIEVKAATYHSIVFRETDEGFYIRVIFDL